MFQTKPAYGCNVERFDFEIVSLSLEQPAFRLGISLSPIMRTNLVLASISGQLSRNPTYTTINVYTLFPYRRVVEPRGMVKHAPDPWPPQLAMCADCVRSISGLHGSENPLVHYLCTRYHQEYSHPNLPACLGEIPITRLAIYFATSPESDKVRRRVNLRTYHQNERTGRTNDWK